MMSLLNCYLPAFRFITDFTMNPQGHTDYDTFRRSAISCLEKAQRESELHHEQEECEAAFFAVVVWLDERVLCSPQEWVKRWRGELLQNNYFSISTGGEAFFIRLDSLDENNKKLRSVYLFCLLMGFHGIYSGQDPLLLQQRIDAERACLPVEWQVWPNESDIIVQNNLTYQGRVAGRKTFRQRKWLMLGIVCVVYLSMYFYGLGYI